MSRGDAEQVRILCQLGLRQMAPAWQRAPCVEVSQEHPMSASGGEDVRMPWDAWVLARKEPGGLAYYVSKRWPVCLTAGAPERLDIDYRGRMPLFFVTTFLRECGQVVSALYNAEVAVKKHMRTFLPPGVQHTLLGEQTSEMMAKIMDYVWQVLAEMTCGEAHMAAVRASSPRCAGKSARLKPWLRDDLERIILLDPSRAARDCGMPRGPLQGERHQPLPHGRRGHWRRLDETRRVWVRPAWIGPMQWQARGQIYRVLDAASEP